MNLIKNKEFDLLILCSKSRLDDNDKAYVQQLLKNQEVSWDRLYDLSCKYGILPLVYKNFKTFFSDLIPEGAKSKFHKTYLIIGARNALLSNELLKILDILEDKGILVLPLKGPVLSDIIYRDDSLRMSSDIDIFIKEEDAIKARNTLIENGYHYLEPLDVRYDPFYLKIEYAFSMQSPDQRINIDLQWKLLGIYTPSPMTLKKIQGDLISRQYMGRTIYHLSMEDLLFYLCVHGTKDGWSKLEWICCISELLKFFNNLDWYQVYDRARQFKCLNKFRLGLYLAKKIYNAPLPAEVENDISANPDLGKIGKGFIDLHLKDIPIRPKLTGNQRFSKFHIQIQDNSYQKLKFIFRQVFRPVKKDIVLMPLHKRLVFLYYLSRPLRLLGQTVKACLENTAR